MTHAERVLSELHAAIVRIAELISCASQDRKYCLLLLAYAEDILGRTRTIQDTMESLLKAAKSPLNSGTFSLMIKLLDHGCSLETLLDGLSISEKNTLTSLLDEYAERTSTSKPSSKE